MSAVLHSGMREAGRIWRGPGDIGGWNECSLDFCSQPCPPSSSASARPGAGETVSSSTSRCAPPFISSSLVLNPLQDNAGVIVNPKGEMKGSAITGPVAKECVRPLVCCSLLLRLTTIFGGTGRSLAPYRLKRWYRGLSAAFLSHFRCLPVHYIVAMPLHNKHMKCTAGDSESHQDRCGTFEIKLIAVEPLSSSVDC